MTLIGKNRAENSNIVPISQKGAGRAGSRIPGLSFISQKAFFGQFRFDVKSRSAEFLISSLILTNSYIWNCSGTKNCKDAYFLCVFTYLLQCGQSHVLLYFHTHQVVCLSFLSSRLPPGGLHRRLKQFLLKTTFTTFTWIGYISPSNHYFSNMTKILTLPEKEGGSKFCFSFHIVNI